MSATVTALMDAINELSRWESGSGVLYVELEEVLDVLAAARAEDPRVAALVEGLGDLLLWYHAVHLRNGEPIEPEHCWVRQCVDYARLLAAPPVAPAAPAVSREGWVCPTHGMCVGCDAARATPQPPVAPAAAGTVERCGFVIRRCPFERDHPTHRHADEAPAHEPDGVCHPFTPAQPATADEAR